VPILPDVLEPGLKVVFVGTAASARSAAVGAPYAGPGNRFWDMLHRIGLTPRRLDPQEFKTAPLYGIGLTGMAPNSIGNDDILRPEDFDPQGVRTKIEQYQPQAVAFVGKRAAQEFGGHKNVSYGLQPERVGTSALFVLPSTSGAARAFWDESYWFKLAEFLRQA